MLSIWLEQKVKSNLTLVKFCLKIKLLRKLLEIEGFSMYISFLELKEKYVEKLLIGLS